MAGKSVILIIQLHELLSVSRTQRGVRHDPIGAAQQGLVGGPMQTPVDASYWPTP
jgi:hypothetical protein